MRLRFRRVEEPDFGLLGRWLADPVVHRWWHQDASPEGVASSFGPTARGEEPAEDFLAVLQQEPGGQGVPIGLIQRCRWDDYPEERDALAPQAELPAGALTVDYLLGERRGEGLGAAVVSAMVCRCWSDFADAPAVIVPVAAGNRASWRTLERAGFRRVGTADLEPDNPADPPAHVVYRVDRPRTQGRCL